MCSNLSKVHLSSPRDGGYVAGKGDVGVVCGSRLV